MSKHQHYKIVSSLKNSLVGCSFLLSTLIASPILADTTADRELFLKLENLARTGKLTADDSQLRSLSDYPLYPYLEYHRLASQGAGLSAKDIEQFEVRFPDTHLEGMLRYQLTKVLADKGRWESFSEYYESLNNPSAEMKCEYTQALFSLGRKAEALALTSELWQQGHSQPDECNPSFNKLFEQGKVSSEVALNRVLNALDEGNPSLATYARKYVTNANDQKIADRAREIYNSPDQIVRHSDDPGVLKPYLARIQHMAISRAYRQSSYTAFEILKLLGSDLEDTADNLALVEKTGVRMAKDLKPVVETELALIDPNFEAHELTEWRIRLALYEQDWQRAHDYIAKLPESKREDDRWRYWQGMTQARLTQSLPEFNELTQERSFYGFLASERTDRPFSMNQQSPRFTEAVYQPLRESQFMARIKELIALDRYTVARSEWNQWKGLLDPQQRQAVGHLMRDIDWYQQGILTAAYEGLWNDLQLRFPTVYFDRFTEHATARKIDPLWALAISRQESALFPWARSSAGARGLMQLMPNTAKLTARKTGINYAGENSLYDPDLNIQLGTAYLSQMYEQFDGNRAYASAAYNAGPHRVARWLENNGADLPLDIWIETIPFDETRTYVQNVLSFALIYGELNSKPVQLLNDKERSQLQVAMR